MADKPRKTGLGVDVFFPKAPKQEKVTPAIPVATPTKPAATDEKQEANDKPLGPLRPRVMKSQRKKERGEAAQKLAGQKANMIKLTVMVDATIYDQLEELKRQERQQLRKAGGEKGHSWRRQITTTQLIDQALAEFLTRNGFKARKS